MLDSPFDRCVALALKAQHVVMRDLEMMLLVLDLLLQGVDASIGRPALGFSQSYSLAEIVEHLLHGVNFFPQAAGRIGEGSGHCGDHDRLALGVVPGRDAAIAALSSFDRNFLSNSVKTAPRPALPALAATIWTTLTLAASDTQALPWLRGGRTAQPGANART